MGGPLRIPDVPEVEGVLVRRCPPVLHDVPGPDEPGVAVTAATCTVSVRMCSWDARYQEVRVSPDTAGDLSWQPAAYVWPESGDRDGVTGWFLTVLGFIEQEARDACEAVAWALLAAGEQSADSRAEVARKA